MTSDYNQQFDSLIKEMTNKLTTSFLENLTSHPNFRGDIDTSPLLNLTMSVYSSSLIHILGIIKSHTEGEQKLMDNIDLAVATLRQAIRSLPFITKVEEVVL